MAKRYPWRDWLQSGLTHCNHIVIFRTTRMTSKARRVIRKNMIYGRLPVCDPAQFLVPSEAAGVFVFGDAMMEFERGKKFGKWVVLEVVGHKAVVQCGCGRIRHVFKSCLRLGKSTQCKSCSAKRTYRREKLKMRDAKEHSRHPLFNTWRGMLSRCDNPNRKDFRRYGAKGIAVCERWRSFKNFVEDVGPRPSLSHSLDRIDSAQGYSPDNVRWATLDQQVANRCNRIRVVLDGVPLTIREAAKRLSMSYGGCYARIRRNELTVVRGAIDEKSDLNFAG